MIRPNPQSTDRTKTAQDLATLATARMQQGLAPPPEIYQVQNRSRIDWSEFPGWAWPLDPEAFDGCCHEG